LNASNEGKTWRYPFSNSSNIEQSNFSLKDPYISPLYGDIHDLPPIFLQAGTNEILYDDFKQFYLQCKNSGRTCELDLWEDGFHVFQMMVGVPFIGKRLNIIQNTFQNMLEFYMSPISARNVLKGKVKKITDGAVNSEVVVELPGGIEIISIITISSVKRLGLEVGKEVSAVIKASNVMIGTDT